jgi:uncharacterized protein (DUF2235 family)
MTMHVVCLDGTGQQKPQKYLTNVAKIFDAMGGVVIDGGYDSWETTLSQNGSVVQTGKYIPGVGTKGYDYLPGVGRQGNDILKVLGLAFGDGIAEQIVRGYTYLSRNYTVGDEIIITGFSRGAAAARALAGFVAGQGLLDPAHYDPADRNTAYLRAIAAWYQYRARDPELARQDRLTDIAVRTKQPIPALTPADYRGVSQIKAVAVFDTVSSVGIPELELDGQAKYDFNLADTVLSSKVETGLQALAADETRDVFAPTYWTNNRTGIIQDIFPGSHSNVGGGYPERGLSDGALAWMLDKLQLAGLRFDIQNIVPPLAPDPLDIARDDSGWPFNLTPQSPRVFPDDAEPATPVAKRWGQLVEVLPSGKTGPYRATGTYSKGPIL